MKSNVVLIAVLTVISLGGTACTNGNNGVVDTDSISKNPTTSSTENSKPSDGQKLADEDGTFVLSAESVVAYGANDTFVEKTLKGTSGCNNGLFGDPLPGVRKACYLVRTTATTLTKLVDEFQAFTVSTPTLIRYGIGDRFVERTVSGSFQCTNEAFGKDPAVGVQKACYAVSTGTVNPPVVVNPPVTPPSTGGKPVRDPAGIFDGNGGVSATAYRAMAAAYGTSAMIPFRFGKDSTAYNPAGVSAPTVYAKPLKVYTNPKESNQVMTYTLGIPKADSGDYSSNEAQVLYVHDPAVAASKPGVDRISTLYMDHGVFSATPQIYWNYKGWGQGNMGRPEQQFLRHFLEPVARANFDAAGGMPQQPVDAVRAYGASEAAGHSLIVFATGQIATGGIATGGGSNVYMRPFPSTYVPTSAAVTSHGEFGLITLWDTQNLKGKVAVIALGGSKPTGDFWNYEFNETYPGFRSYSIWNFAKLLGYVDLPDDMIAPTSIEAVGDVMIGNGLAWLPGTRNPGDFPLTNQSNWNCFKSNPECAFNRSGFALVASRYEKKVAVLDLKPLFSKIQRGMFSDWTMFRQNVGNTGQGANQWPQTFAADSSSIPRYVKTLTFDKEVTAVSATLRSDNFGLIATEDGIIHVYDVDGLQTGGTGANIREVRTYQVGRNVTRIAHMKHAVCCGDGGEIRYQFITSSRGDKRADWIDLKQNRIIRTMRDSRIVDLMSVEDNNTHGTQSDVLTVLDYGAKKVRGYRYGPVIFRTDGGARYDMGPNGQDDFEYSGDYDTPTGPFIISIENVT